MKQTIRLLRVVGSPFISEAELEDPPDDHEALRLYYYAARNRMAFLYLTALKKWRELGKLQGIYDDMHRKVVKTDCAFSRVSRILGNAGIQHALFKTIRPYRSTTVDIDVIIFGSDKEYQMSIGAMKTAGYKELGFGPNSTTIQDPYIGIGVDLYREVAVSKIIYLDKTKLHHHVTENDELVHSDPVATLFPSADLIALIAHSVIKEHMYTLSEYYSTLYFLDRMSSENIRDFVNMTHDNNVVTAARVHLGMTLQLHEAAYGVCPEKLSGIIDKIGIDPLETSRVRMSHDAPYKFHILTIAKTLSEKMRKDSKARKSMARQIVSFVDPRFMGEIVKRVLDQISRESY